MNPVLLIAYNNVDLTKKALASILNQDIPVTVWLINNGSKDGTRQWAESVAADNVKVQHYPDNISPLHIGNMWAEMIFALGAKHILGIPNDATFPPNMYSELLRFPYGFVSAGMACPDDVPPAQTAEMLHNDCHFSVMLVRKWAHEALISAYGFFHDEDYFHYASDCDMKQRWNRVGILGCQTSIQCWHYGSATWRLAEESERRGMLAKADVDRETYFRKWGERL